MSKSCLVKIKNVKPKAHIPILVCQILCLIGRKNNEGMGYSTPHSVLGISKKDFGKQSGYWSELHQHSCHPCHLLEPGQSLEGCGACDICAEFLICSEMLTPFLFLPIPALPHPFLPPHTPSALRPRSSPSPDATKHMIRGRY